jgi:hypothetical protein
VAALKASLGRLDLVEVSKASHSAATFVEVLSELSLQIVPSLGSRHRRLGGPALRTESIGLSQELGVLSVPCQQRDGSLKERRKAAPAHCRWIPTLLRFCWNGSDSARKQPGIGSSPVRGPTIPTTRVL